MAIEPIREGEPVRKFDQIIGFAKTHIAPGEWVHVHNVGLHEFARDYRFAEDAQDDDLLPGRACAPPSRATGAPNGKTGTRNYIGILTSRELLGLGRALRRGGGRALRRARRLSRTSTASSPSSTAPAAAMPAYGEGFDILRRTLWGFASHPNFAGVLMVGLGCEVFQIGRMKKEYGLTETDTFRTMTIQETGGTSKTVEAIVDADPATCCRSRRSAQRETRPASELMLALQCGGSDGYSGITANPALGAASDLLVRHGGTAILSETPEIYGAEHLLTRRAATPRGRREAGRAHPAGGRTTRARNGGEMNNNPSPGNKAGGLTTILEKSLGAAAKGGTADAARRLRIRRAGHGAGLRLHGHARLRPGRRDRPGRRRRAT